MPLVPSGKFTKRITILTVARAPKGTNGEEIPDWPDPPSGDGSYSAAVETFAANEVSAQGQNHATGSKRLRVRGRRIPVTTDDHIRDKVTGEEYSVTAVARDDHDTIIDVSRWIGQETGQ